jgi:hypothetical protein
MFKSGSGSGACIGAREASMPFRHEDTSAFGPEDLKILHEVFDLAWRRILADGFDTNNYEEVENARRLLATCIMTNAKPGQLDVDLLFERCLGAFRQRWSGV